jgi:hypothetical protein
MKTVGTNSDRMLSWFDRTKAKRIFVEKAFLACGFTCKNVNSYEVLEESFVKRELPPSVRLIDIAND